MDALLKEISEAKKRLPKSKTQLKVLERLLEQESSKGPCIESSKGPWKKVEGTKVLSKQEQVEKLQSEALLQSEKD